MDTATGRVRVRKSPEVVKGKLALQVLKRVAVLSMVGGAGSALAQTVTVTPSVETRLSWTDNVGASAQDKRQDWFAEIAPGIAISRESGRFSGRLNAELRNVAYASESDRNTSFVALQGRGQLEAVENLLFVDMDAAISRNNLSAFTGRSSVDTLNTDENDETRTWSLAPRMQFRYGDAEGSLGYLSRWVDSGGSALGQQRLSQWTAQAGSPSAFRVLGWGLNYSRSDSDYGSSTTSGGSNSVNKEVGRATLYINVTPQFRLRAIGGRESNDYANGRKESGTIYGGGFDWNPTERTIIEATTEERIFGRGYDFRFNHRMARSSWNLQFSKDFSSGLESFGQSRQLTQQERLCAQIAALVSSDPAQQEQFYQSCLVALGFDPFAARQTLRSNAQFIDKSMQAGFSLTGVRNVLSFTLMRSDRTRVGSGGSLATDDDFANTDRVLTTAGTVALSHRLSGYSSLNFSVTRERSEGASGTNLDTRRLFMLVGLTTQLGPNTYGGLNYRYQRSDGSSAGSDFTENSITANLGMRF
ncbi:TIGR03016 family PEP-CTERM system-associated outer membrane protein [Azoarcus sp. DD4]|nr:TIGR03016 family PEP-CTERM system-associated outer membrane protein [Azoarcus sp. DD4]